MPLALLAALPPSPCAEQGTKNHEHHSNYRTQATSARRCFYLQGRGDVWVQLPPCFFPGALPPWGKPTQRGASEVSAATQWKGDSTQHFQIPSPALQSLLDSNITRETDQGKDTARYAANYRS